jgi:D-3-phosphoglycerate dehydrogenase
MNLLINLPKTFFTVPQLADRWAKLGKLGENRHTSHDTPEQIMADLKWAEAVIMWSWPFFTDQMLAQTPKLKFVGQINSARTTVQACLGRGIAISETRHCWSPAVAEMALTLMLAGLRRTSDYHAAMRAGTEQWVADMPADVDVSERQLTGLTVGLVGFGGIGRRLAELLKPFHVNLLTHDPYVPASVAEGLGARLASVAEIAGSADVVVLCATGKEPKPAGRQAESEKIQYVFPAEAINAMRPMSVLVNISRASLVDMDALSVRLAKGDLIAMLDVFSAEPLPKDSPLRSLPNTYLTPHRAGGLMQSVERAIDWLSGDLMSFLENKPRKYGVTEAMLPSFVD